MEMLRNKWNDCRCMLCKKEEKHNLLLVALAVVGAITLMAALVIVICHYKKKAGCSVCSMTEAEEEPALQDEDESEPEDVTEEDFED